MYFSDEVKERIADFHTHILPGMDDGAKDPETAIAMLRKIYDSGLRRAVLTPHFYPWRESPEEFMLRCENALLALTNAGAAQIGVRLTLGAEVAYFRGIGRSEAVRQLTVGSSKLILVELPFEKWDQTVFDDLSDLAVRGGLTPVLAHLDRYPEANRKVWQEVRQRGFLVQCNAEHFLGKRPPARLLRMMSADRIDFLGSDCHNMTDRAPCLGEALDRLFDHGYANSFIHLSKNSAMFD